MNVFTGFTPAPDCIRDAIDPLAALVFGTVWRFAQMDRGQCDATVETIASRTGIGTTATRERLRRLEGDGWIVSEARAGLPTIYRDTGRWALRVIGEDTEPQRQTLGGATRGVGGGQREALAEDTRYKIQNKREFASASADAQPTTKPRKQHPDTRVVLDLYREALGYALPNGGADATAASWMLGQGFTPSEIIGTYHRLKLEPFWEDRHLGLQSVKKQIGAMVRRSAPAPTATPAAPSFEYDESYLRTAARS